MKKNPWMKKCCAFVAVMASMFVVCGCGNKADKLKPYEWLMDDKVVSYYDSAKDLDETICTVYDHWLDAAKADSENSVFSKDGEEIRSFHTRDKEVVTYKGIHVGDKATKVAETFAYEINIGESYNVYFDGTTEINAEEQDVEDDFIILYYYVEEGIIKEISVMDVVYGGTWS